MFHQVCCHNCSTARHSCLAVNHYISVFEVLYDELVGGIKKAFDVLIGTVTNKNSKMVDITFKFKFAFSKNRNNCSKIVLSKLIIIFNKSIVTQCQTSPIRWVRLDNPIHAFDGHWVERRSSWVLLFNRNLIACDWLFLVIFLNLDLHVKS